LDRPREAIHSLYYDPYPHDQSLFIMIMNHDRVNMIEKLRNLFPKEKQVLYINTPTGNYAKYIHLSKDNENFE
jgi:hypothetical protein